MNLTSNCVNPNGCGWLEIKLYALRIGPHTYVCMSQTTIAKRWYFLHKTFRSLCQKPNYKFRRFSTKYFQWRAHTISAYLFWPFIFCSVICFRHFLLAFFYSLYQHRHHQYRTNPVFTFELSAVFAYRRQRESLHQKQLWNSFNH